MDWEKEQEGSTVNKDSSNMIHVIWILLVLFTH